MSKIHYAKSKPSLVAGNGLFAITSIDAGQTIVSLDRPLVTVLDQPRLIDTCSHCCIWTQDNLCSDGVQEMNVSACTGCKVARYCSKKCQTQSWKRSHKWECKHLEQIPNAPNAVRAALQLRILLEHDTVPDQIKRAARNAAMNDGVFNRHLQADFPPSYYSHVKKESANANPGTETVEDSLKKIMTNALTIVTPTFDPLGIAFDPLVCSANHACDPNALVVFDGAVVSLRSLRSIVKDEELFISYIDSTNPFAERQHELRDRYGFDCACTKCEAEKAQYSTSRQLTRASTKDLFADLDRARSSPDDHASIIICTSILGRCTVAEQQPSAAARDELFARLCTVGDYSSALQHGIKRYFNIDPVLYPQAFHPVRVVHTWALVKVLLWLYSRPEDIQTKQFIDRGFDFVVPIWKLLKPLTILVDCSHGSDSLFARVVKSVAVEVRDGITATGLQNLALIESDPGGFWRVFQSLAHIDEL